MDLLEKARKNLIKAACFRELSVFQCRGLAVMKRNNIRIT